MCEEKEFQVTNALDSTTEWKLYLKKILRLVSNNDYKNFLKSRDLSELTKEQFVNLLVSIVIKYFKEKHPSVFEFEFNDFDDSKSFEENLEQYNKKFDEFYLNDIGYQEAILCLKVLYKQKVFDDLENLLSKK